MLRRPRRALRRLGARSEAERVPARRKPQRATPPNVIGEGPLVAAPGLRLGVVAMLRNEAPYLEEWLCYHIALGVEHFFIYDNNSDDELHEIMERYVSHGLATLVFWPMRGGQLDAYSHALRFYGPSVDWLAYFDVDEFVVPLVDDDIPAFLARFPDAADVRIPRVEFGFSGHRTPPEALTIEAYTGVADVFDRDPSKPPRVKTIVQSRGISAVGIHTATVADVPMARDDRPVPTRSIRTGARGYAQLNHYYTRSFEEFEAKRFRGSGTGRIARPPVPFDIPTLREDTSAHRFIERTRATIERIRSLEPQPYHYGSELALGQFPRSNDLGLFSEFAFANVVNEEPEPRREPRTRLLNLYAATGFVGDIGDSDHQPRRGELSGSIHLGLLLERARARVDVEWAAGSDAASRSVVRGRLEDDGQVWHLAAKDGSAEVVLPIDPGGRRRCYALGFVLETPGPARLELALQRDGTDGREASLGDLGSGSASDPVVVPLEAASTYAGVVEFDARPALVREAGLRLRWQGAPIGVHDLFVLSYG